MIESRTKQQRRQAKERLRTRTSTDPGETRLFAPEQAGEKIGHSANARQFCKVAPRQDEDIALMVVKSGKAPERDNIFQSNQRARLGA